MKYLGTLAGEGCILHDGMDLTRAQFEFDGYSTSHAGVICSGELRMPAVMLERAFLLRTVQLRTDDGRMLEVRFSDNKIRPDQDAAHVDVRGEIPGNDKRKWAGGRGPDRLAIGDVTPNLAAADRELCNGATYYSSFGGGQARSHRVMK